MPWRALAALLVGSALATPARAHEAPGMLPLMLSARAGRLIAAVDLAAAFPPDLQRQLGSGLTNVVAVYVSLVPEHGEVPVSVYGREVDVLYDVWDESFAVTLKDPATPRGRRLVFRDFTALHAFLSRVDDVDLGPASILASGSWVIQTRVDLNPVSKELLDRTRELIANPAAGSRVGGGSRSVLGAMASYLLRGADPGGDTHLFRSRPFTRAEVGPR